MRGKMRSKVITEILGLKHKIYNDLTLDDDSERLLKASNSAKNLVYKIA